MKKIILSTAIIAAISLASCRKAGYTCTCTYEDGSKYSTEQLEKVSKKEAEKACTEGYTYKVSFLGVDAGTETPDPDDYKGCALD